MQLENVNWTDYSWWVMMSLFRSKILISINFFRPVARLFQASEKKVQTISFTIWRLVYDFWIFFLLRFKVFVLKTSIFIHREKDWVINRIVNDIKYYIFFPSEKRKYLHYLNGTCKRYIIFTIWKILRNDLDSDWLLIYFC